MNRAELLTHILKSAAADKNKIAISEDRLSRAIIYSVETGELDYGRVIGKEAKNIKSLNVLVGLMCAKEEMSGVAEVSIPRNNKKPEPSPYPDKESWSESDILGIVKGICSHAFVSPGTVVCKKVSNGFAIEIRIPEEESFEYYDKESGQIAIYSDEDVRESVKTVLKMASNANGCKISAFDLVRTYIPNTNTKR